MNNYRVDRAVEALSPPCGMNSILYVGDSHDEALRIFKYAEGGKDAWNQPDRNCGVMLSMWDAGRNMYVTKRWKNK
jgi:hypothetical protein